MIRRIIEYLKLKLHRKKPTTGDTAVGVFTSLLTASRLDSIVRNKDTSRSNNISRNLLEYLPSLIAAVILVSALSFLGVTPLPFHKRIIYKTKLLFRKLRLKLVGY